MKTTILSLMLFPVASYGYVGPIHNDHCLDHIQKAGVLCWTAPLKDLNDMHPVDSCGPDPSDAPEKKLKYLKVLKNIYFLYPKALQRVFCSIDHIIIMPNNYFAGDAEPVKENNVIKGATLYLNENLVNGRTMNKYLEGKARLPFGRTAPIQISAPEIEGISTSAFFVIAHEFAHILDLYNQKSSEINPQGCEMESSPFVIKRCSPIPGGWMAFSWISATESRFDSEEFPLRVQTFGGVPRGIPPTKGPYLPIDTIDKALTQLFKTTFVSFLAAFQTFDDWAESVAWFIYTSRVKSHVLIHDTFWKSIRSDIALQFVRA